MVNIERILIVGGGIAGLTVATALNRQGFRAKLVERSASWHATGAGILLHATGMWVLRALGLGEAVENAGAVVRHWSFCDQYGEVLCDTDLEELWGNIGPCIGIERPRLQKTLLTGAAAVPCRLGLSVTSLIQDEQLVLVSFSDGSTGIYDLVVGADGIYSTVRTLVMGTVDPGYTGLMIWRSLVPIRPLGVTNFRLMLGDGCFFGIMPMGDGHSNVFGGVGIPRSHDPVQGRLERFRKRFTGFGGQVQECLAAISSDKQIYCGPIELVKIYSWRKGRVVLIGDAAHAGPPTMAEGGCMAMEDAYVLAEVLHHEETVESALDSYVTRRRPRANWVQQQSRGVVESLLMPPSQRNPTFRESGNQGMHDRFGPLIPEP
jgi:2-polyprenyl-6-methoxyphenol hydroxylase-like FAD-dependent oxidoreductase